MGRKGKPHSLVDRIGIFSKTFPHIGVYRKVRDNMDYFSFLIENGYELRTDHPMYIEFLDMLLEKPEETRQLVGLGIRLNYKHSYEDARRVYREYGEEGLRLCSREGYSGLEFYVRPFYELVKSVGYERVRELREYRGWSILDIGGLISLEGKLGEENFQRAVSFLQAHVNDATKSNPLGHNPVYRIEAVYPYMDRIEEVERSGSQEQSGEIEIRGTVTDVSFRGSTSMIYPAFGIRRWHPENYGSSVVAQFTAKSELIEIFIKYLKTEFSITGHQIRISDG